MTVPPVRVGAKFQVTIPRKVREAVRLSPGDLVQASVGEGNTIVLRPMLLVDRQAKPPEAPTAGNSANESQLPGAGRRLLRGRKRS